MSFLIIPTKTDTFLEKNKEVQEKTQNWIDKGKEDGRENRFEEKEVQVFYILQIEYLDFPSIFFWLFGAPWAYSL